MYEEGGKQYVVGEFFGGWLECCIDQCEVVYGDVDVDQGEGGCDGDLGEFGMYGWMDLVREVVGLFVWW